MHDKCDKEWLDWVLRGSQALPPPTLSESCCCPEADPREEAGGHSTLPCSLDCDHPQRRPSSVGGVR